MDSRLSGSCSDCGYPIILDYGEMKWIKRKHKCEFIPEEIKALFDHKKIAKIVKDFRRKYSVNSDDKIVMVTVPWVMGCLMDSLEDKFYSNNDQFDEWWNSGFVPMGPDDHYQLLKYARDLCTL